MPETRRCTINKDIQQIFLRNAVCLPTSSTISHCCATLYDIIQSSWPSSHFQARRSYSTPDFSCSKQECLGKGEQTKILPDVLQKHLTFHRWNTAQSYMECPIQVFQMQELYDLCNVNVLQKSSCLKMATRGRVSVVAIIVLTSNKSECVYMILHVLTWVRTFNMMCKRYKYAT